MKPKTIIDISRKTGISCPQVSRALNGVKGVSKETAQKVIDAAKEIGYTRNELARSLVKKQSLNIAFLANDISNPNTASISLSIVSTAYQYGYQTFLGSCFWDYNVQKAQINSMIQNRVAGILLTPSTDNYDEFQSLSTPVVCINSLVSDNLSSVVVDNIGGEYKAIEYLIKGGYKKIAFVGGAEISLSNKARLTGYKKALDSYGIPINTDYIKHGSFNLESGYETAKLMLESPNPPDAMICANDILALGVLKYCKDKSINVPDQLGIIGFDDNFVASLPQINLTSITVSNPEPIGVRATKVLINHIENDNRIVHETLETKLVIRETTRKVK
ncbi:MAG: LacI family DNA-binding transcriptional regulator [Christensenellales bacterium]